jgi:hypothetical protein
MNRFSCKIKLCEAKKPQGEICALPIRGGDQVQHRIFQISDIFERMAHRFNQADSASLLSNKNYYSVGANSQRGWLMSNGDPANHSIAVDINNGYRVIGELGHVEFFPFLV